MIFSVAKALGCKHAQIAELIGEDHITASRTLALQKATASLSS